MQGHTYLAHKQDGVENDEQHDKVLKGRGGDEPPDVVADPRLALGHVHLLRLGLHHVRYAGFLKNQFFSLASFFIFKRRN